MLFGDAGLAEEMTQQPFTEVWSRFETLENPSAYPNAALGEWILIRGSSAVPPRSWTRSRINTVVVWKAPGAGTRMVYDIPASGLRLTVTGSGAANVVRMLEPSASSAFVAADYPTPVPESWKRITYDGIHLRVPSARPVRELGRQPAPGACGGDAFADPAVDIGPGSADPVMCPATGGGLNEDPGDGIWLNANARSDNAGNEVRPGGPVNLARSYLVHDGSVAVRYSRYPDNDLVSLFIDVEGRYLRDSLGLGVDPATAETVLSSILTGGQPTTPLD